jgi:hypothetical protein
MRTVNCWKLGFIQVLLCAKYRYPNLGIDGLALLLLPILEVLLRSTLFETLNSQLDDRLVNRVKCSLEDGHGIPLPRNTRDVVNDPAQTTKNRQGSQQQDIRHHEPCQRFKGTNIHHGGSKIYLETPKERQPTSNQRSPPHKALEGRRPLRGLVLLFDGVLFNIRSRTLPSLLCIGKGLSYDFS